MEREQELDRDKIGAAVKVLTDAFEANGIEKVYGVCAMRVLIEIIADTDGISVELSKTPADDGAVH